jgi:hypothetical protein
MTPREETGIGDASGFEKDMIGSLLLDDED